jgi:hypothetical protein
VSPSLFKAKATGPNGEEAKVKLSANPGLKNYYFFVPYYERADS